MYFSEETQMDSELVATGAAILDIIAMVGGGAYIFFTVGRWMGVF